MEQLEEILENTREEDIGNIVSQYGMEYAKGVILDRALPNIDGFKPSQRRVLYTMKKMGLTDGKKAKSSKIAGQVLTYHPHGDAAVYLTMVAMTDSTEVYNIPYVSGKGSFGKVYLRDLPCSKPRYTEAGLCPITKEVFEGMNEGASNMVPNFDSTEVEPELLPVKFPTLLVNPISGIAVGKSCNIPSFPLVNVCMATAGVAAGKITTPEELADVLVCPEYTTGGTIHTDKKLMVQLCKTGHAKFTISGTADVYGNRIEINEIPFTTTSEAIVDEIRELIQDKKLTEISKVHNGVGLNKFQIKVFVKRGYNTEDVLKKLYRMTSLRDKISYRVRIVYKNECIDDIGILELLNMWLEYRHECLVNQHKFKLQKINEKQHKLETWEKIKDHVEEVGAEIPKHSQKEVEDWLKSKFTLDDIQVDYLLSMQSRSITKDNMVKNLDELKSILAEKADINDVVDNKERRTKIIIEQQQEISKKYGKEPVSRIGELIVPEREAVEKISDETVVIKYTKNGMIKRLVGINPLMTFQCPLGDRVLRTINMKNNEYLLVFTTDGEMYKVLANDIDASRGDMRESLVDKLKLESASKILWVDGAGDYTGSFNLIYPNGKGEKVRYEKAAGKRMKYISMYEPVTPGQAWISQEDKFFVITSLRKASYVDISQMGIFTSSHVFRAIRIRGGERIIGVQPMSKVPNPHLIDIEKYNKPYTVLIKDDILWDNSEQEKIKKEQERQIEEQKELIRQKEEREKMKELDKILASIRED